MEGTISAKCGRIVPSTTVENVGRLNENPHISITTITQDEQRAIEMIGAAMSARNKNIRKNVFIHDLRKTREYVEKVMMDVVHVLASVYMRTGGIIW